MTPQFINKAYGYYMRLVLSGVKDKVPKVGRNMSEFIFHATKQWLCFIAVLLITACTSNVVDIGIEDEASYRTIEASFHFSKQSDGNIKIRMSKTSGDDRKIVPAGKIIKIEGDEINGPTEVFGDAELTYYSISYGNEIFLGDMFPDDKMSPQEVYGTWYIGLAQTGMDFHLDHQGSQYNVTGKTTELYGQVGITYPISPSFDAMATVALSMGRNLSSTSEYDLKFNYKLAENIGIMGGYRWLEYDYFKEDKSDIEIKFRGPFLGLNVPL